MEFKKSSSPPFEGTANPDEVDVLVEQIEKAFAVIECTEKEKLGFGVYILKGTMNRYYKGELHIHQG